MNVFIFLQNMMYLSKEAQVQIILLIEILCIEENAGHIEQVL